MRDRTQRLTWAARQPWRRACLGAQTLVLLEGAATSYVVASVVAPGTFHTHLQRAGVGHTAAETIHVDRRASTTPSSIALGVALVTSVLMALGVTAYFTRRVQRSTAAVAESAADIASGQYGARVPSPGLGSEFDLLATTINELAERLGDVETTRRRILADLAHEMRTPLASIGAHLEAVEDGVRDAGRGHACRAAQRHPAAAAPGRGHQRRLPEPRREGWSHAPFQRLPGRCWSAAAATARDAFDAKGVELLVDADTVAGPVLVDPSAWLRSWETSWTTRCATRHPAAP